MSTQSKPLKPTHVIAEMHEACGTNIRNAKTRACVECDRLRHRKDFVAKPRVKKVATQPVAVAPVPPFAIAKPEVSKEPVLSQTKKPEERLAVIEQIQTDLEKFLKSGGKINTVSSNFFENQNIKHGTRHAYVIKQCRCGKCMSSCNKHSFGRGSIA